MKRKKRGPGRPPGRTSDTTRSNVLRAARVCFARSGFAVTTNRDIADLAGVTPAALYQYFDSKVALYAAVAHEAAATVASHMRSQTVNQDSAVASLSAIVRSLIALHERDRSLAAFLSALPGELRRHPELAQSFVPGRDAELSTVMGEIVKRAVALGELEERDARRAAEMFIACMMGLSQYAVFVRDGAQPATAFADLLEGRLFARAKTRPTARPSSRRPAPVRTRARAD
jgi:AcrR family transcriptional regulator